jgi:hypothetical protein
MVEEILMWDVIKNAVTELKDALGIEIPGLPSDVGSIDAASIGEAATTATEGVTQSATTAVEDLTATVGQAVTDAGTQVSETVSGIADAPR